MKYLLLICCYLSLTSCSNADGNHNRFIGKWEYSTHFEDNIQYFSYQCKRSTIDFYSNNNSVQKDYAIGLNGNCEIFFVNNSNLEKINENEYKFGFIPVQNTPVWNESVKVQNDSLIIDLIRSEDSWNFRQDRYIYLKKR